MPDDAAAEPWYRAYFTPEYWALAAREYTPERTGRELAYLGEVLRDAPGARLADLGCGIGRHAIPLARMGFDVVGVDVSEWTIDTAAKRAADAGVTIEWHVQDLLSAAPWPIGECDAILSIQAFGWGSDADQQRMLRRIRRHLRPAGLLLLDHSNVLAILRHFVPSASDASGGTRYDFERTYDPLTGRSRGEVRVSGAGGLQRVLPHDVRLYTPEQVGAMLRRCGFRVERADADFTIAAPVDMDTRYVQLLARPAPAPPEKLAVRSYRASTDRSALDLRWCPDEEEWLAPRPRDIWDEVIRSAADDGFGTARAYAVEDPYGDHGAADIVGRHFGVSLPSGCLTFGAGATDLLRQLARLAEGGMVLAAGAGHPDLPAWARLEGCDLQFFEDATAATTLARRLRRARPALLVLDRPNVLGEAAPLPELTMLARAAGAAGTIVVIDEAYATYLGPEASAVPLALRGDNLIVIRSISKGYGCGGLRVGFAVASPPLSQAVRAAATPLAASSLPYQFALRLLASGDLLAPLRRRIRAVKPRVAERLEQLGLQPLGGTATLPWLAVPDPDGAALAVLRARGITAKPIAGADDHPPSLLRVAVPLSSARLERFERLTAGSSRGS